MHKEIIENKKPDGIKDLIENLLPYFAILIKNLKKYLIINFVIAVIVAVLLLLFAKPYYESKLVIYPDIEKINSSLAGLSSLASLVGVSVGGGNSMGIYQNLIKSEYLLKYVIYGRYKTEASEDSVNLIEYYEIEPDESLPPNQRERDQFLTVYTYLTEKIISTDLDDLTQILSVTVRMPESKLSADVANNIAYSLDEYMREKRKSYASEQTNYLAGRLVVIKDSLEIAEESLKSFQEENRNISRSPELLLEQQRLMRNVEILQTIYIELTKQYELSKLEQVKDIPVINIRETVNEPILKAGPPRTVYFLLLMIFFAMITALYFIFQPYLQLYYNTIRYGLFN